MDRVSVRKATVGNRPWSNNSHILLVSLDRTVRQHVYLPQAGTKLRSVKQVSVWEEMNPRFRKTMEDAHVIVDQFGGNPDTGMFGVYDGHGGRTVASYLRTHLHENIVTELHDIGARSVEECLKTAFVMTDMECSKTGGGGMPS